MLALWYAFWSWGSSGAITGTAATSQSAQSVAASGTEVFTGTETSQQPAQTVAAAAVEVFTGTESGQQPSQTLAAAAVEVFTGSESSSQPLQTLAASASEIFTAAAATSQPAQTLSATETEIFTGAESSAQPAQTLAASGSEVFSAAASGAQPAQQLVASEEALSGDCATQQSAQACRAAGTHLAPQQQLLVWGEPQPIYYRPPRITGTAVAGQKKQKVVAFGALGMGGAANTEQMPLEFAAQADNLDVIALIEILSAAA